MKNIKQNNLREYRLKTGLRQRDAAELLKLDCRDRISKWEGGHAMPSVANLFRLAAAYKTDPQNLYQEFWRSLVTDSSHTTDEVIAAETDPAHLDVASR